MKIMGGGGPITENLGMRFSASINETDGPFQNKYTGEDVHRGSGKTLRWRTRWTGERTTADLILGASHYEGGAIAFNAQIAGTYTGGVWIPGPDTDAVHDIPFVNDMPGYNEQRKRNASLRIVHEFDNMTLSQSVLTAPLRTITRPRVSPMPISPTRTITTVCTMLTETCSCPTSGPMRLGT